jgi:hypothetical protein
MQLLIVKDILVQMEYVKEIKDKYNADREYVKMELELQIKHVIIIKKVV